MTLFYAGSWFAFFLVLPTVFRFLAKVTPEGGPMMTNMRAGGVPQSQLVQRLGQLQVVAFFPHDLVIITGEPAERRRSARRGSIPRDCQ